jgi:hypothetical protein
MLYRDYDLKGSVGKRKIKASGLESQGVWHQDEQIGGKQPVVK